ncbi:MAG: hypothetical protein RAO92_09240 [Candidatus Euphemobacter frigidus]|nr:hypothetical protein [Candidatus Euphemobacter frigidus]MDP8276570.1 hypothetical protein [Candidatus Euphemobacter frigidus]
MKIMLMSGVIIGICWGAVPAFTQNTVDPNELKISPVKYKNLSIVLQDNFINVRAGIPPALTAAGYTTQKYITFGCKTAGMRCFLRRNSANENLIAQFKKGERITIRGTVKQPKAKVKRADGRITDRYKLDIYIILASEVKKGWE